MYTDKTSRTLQTHQLWFPCTGAVNLRTCSISFSIFVVTQRPYSITCSIVHGVTTYVLHESQFCTEHRCMLSV